MATRDTSIGTLSVGLELDATGFQAGVAEAQSALSGAAEGLREAAEGIEAAPVAEVAEELGTAGSAVQDFGRQADSVLSTLNAWAREVDGVVSGTRSQATAQADVAEAAKEATEATAEQAEVLSEATEVNNDFDLSLTLVSGTLLKYVKDAAGAATRTSAFRAVLAALANPVTAVVAGLGALVLAVRELDQALDETAHRLAADGLLGDVDASLAQIEGRYQLSAGAAAVYTQRLEEQTAESKAAEVAAAEFFARLSPFADLFDRVTASADEFKAKVYEIGVVIYDTLAATNKWLPALREVAEDPLEDVAALLPGRIQGLARTARAKLADVLVTEGEDVARDAARALGYYLDQEVGNVTKLKNLEALNAYLDNILKPPPEVARFKPEIIAQSLRDLQGLADFDEFRLYAPVIDDIEQLASGTRLAAEELSELSAQLVAGGDTAQVFAEAISLEGLDLSPLRGAERAMTTYQARVEATEEAWGRVGATATDVLEEMITGTGEARDVLASLAKVFFDLLGAGLGGVLGGVGFAGGIKDFFRFPGRASGGPVVGGQAYVVGEDGPELLIPAVAGTVVPNDRLGATVNVTLNAAAGVDAAAFDRLLLRRLPDIRRSVEAGMRAGG